MRVCVTYHSDPDTWFFLDFEDEEAGSWKVIEGRAINDGHTIFESCAHDESLTPKAIIPEELF